MNLFKQISNFASDASDSIGDLFGGSGDGYGFQGGMIDEDYAGYSGSSFMDPSQDPVYVGPDDELSPYYGSMPATLGNIEAYDRSDPYASTQYYGQYDVEFEDDRSYAQMIKEGLFEALGVGKETAGAISRFAHGAKKGGGKERQAQAGGRTGPALPTSARAPTTPAGRISRARQATSGERAVQAAISQSNRAQSAARAIADQMARAGTVTTTNDLADMISGSTKPMGTRQKLPGANLRQLAIPRTGMA